MEKKIDKLLLGVEEILKAVTQNQISSRKPTIQQSNSFDDDDLHFHDEGYDIEDAIGMGNNPVYRVKDSKTEELFALKCISLDDNEVTPAVARELSLMFDIQHEHIVRLNRAFFHRNSLCLIMELAYDDLNESIAMKSLISSDSDDVKTWMKQIISAIAYLNNRSIIHRDLKPANILVSANRNMKLADFGLARVLFEGAQLTPRVMTLEYRAPELLLGCETYSSAVDMWSLGCIFWDMIMSKSIFESLAGTEEEMIEDIFKKLGTPNESTWPGVTFLPKFPKDTPFYTAEIFEAIETKVDANGLDLLKKLLCLNPKLRIKADEAMKHPYCTS